MSIKSRLKTIDDQIRAAEKEFDREPDSVRLIAVSKKQPVTAIAEAIAAGQLDFGENYLQEAEPKIEAFAEHALKWHFIGPIQTNKTKTIAQQFDWVHTVSRLKIAKRLHEQRPDDKPPLNICIQVNISGEASKSGVSLAALDDLAHEIQQFPRLCLRGLMTIPKPEPTFEQQYAVFHQLQQRFIVLRKNIDTLDNLSMGMSADFRAAIAAGATMVRLGTAVFGPRV